MALYYEDEHVQLHHGDCRAVWDWTRADVLVTDPPYGIPGGRVGWHKGSPRHADAAWDCLDVRDVVLEAWGAKPRAVFGTPKAVGRAPSFRGVPLVWDKGDSPGMGDLAWPFGASYELIWVSGDGWNGTRRSSILRAPFSVASSGGDHPTPKPVALMEAIISYAPAGVIADPFAGSGSTLIAARNLGRKAIGVELEEKYCEIAAKRLSQQAFDFSALEESA